ncbi:MAG: (Fe-S)-binding protein, partial [Dehalococcoidales bacterium]
GRRTESYRQLLKRALYTGFAVFGQWCQLKNLTRKDRASIGHAFMAWGFFIFVVFYFFFIILGAGFGLSETLENTQFFFYYAWVMDIAAIFGIAGAGWGIIRRYVVRPPRLKGEQTFEALIILVSVLLHPVTHLFKEATSIALGHPPVGLGETLPPISNTLSNVFNNATVSGIETASVWFFWAHWLVVLFVLVYIGYSRYLHVLASIFNILFQTAPPKGALQPIDLKNAKSLGAGNITDLTWKQILDLYSCVSCGQCQDLCPATASGKPLNPKLLIQDLKDHLFDVGPGLLKERKQVVVTEEDDAKGKESSENTLVDAVITEDEIWACTTCRACDNICPVWVDHVDKIVDLRRNLVMTSKSEAARDPLRNIRQRGHPWTGTVFSREDWIEGLDVKILAEDNQVDVLYWVGCTEALEDRSIKIAKAMGKLMKEAGESFGILGEEESCCGDPARRLGNERQFQLQAQKNIKMMNEYGVKKIVTGCPHCYNTIKNEYPQFGGEFEVYHHTEYIGQMIKEGKIKVEGGGSGVVTYQDPCYLGRYNGIYGEPREILKGIPGMKMIEMALNHEESFCCGGGGGRMWLEENIGERISEMRVERAIETEAGVVATACPFCLQMFEDAVKVKGVEERLKVRDIAEILADKVT